MFELRPEQRPPCEQAKLILARYNCVYIAGEIRTGKTPISLMTAYESGWRSVCVLTKKNAITGFNKFNPGLMFNKITITNYEQVHKLIPEYDGYIIDESHNLGAYPKPSGRTKKIKEIVGNKPVILLSGTPTPEGFSQIYHQFWVCNYGPFQRYASTIKSSGFYKWAKDFVKHYEYVEDGETKYRVKQKYVYGNNVNDYSEAKEQEVKEAIHPYFVYLTQQEAGFTSFVEEEILTVKIDHRLYRLMSILKKDKYYKMKCGDEIVVETGVRLQSLFHQISSGSVNISYIEEGKDGKKAKKKHKKHTLDESKAYFIKSRFAGQKICIFYLFVQEGEILKKIFPNYTSDQDVFNASEDKEFICQMVSGREGVNVSTADAVIMYNIGFSATTYWQIRGRMQEKERKKASKLYWIFSEFGIEHKVYKAVTNKLDYTLSYFKKDLRTWNLEHIGNVRG